MNNEEFLKLFELTAKSDEFMISESSINLYLYQVKRFINFLDNKPISDINEDDVKGYLLQLSSGARTNKNVLSALHTFYKVLMFNPISKKDISVDPTFYIKGARKIVCAKKPSLTKLEQSQLLKGAKNSRDVAIITTYLECGVRQEELAALTLDQYLNREDGWVTLTITKGSKERDIYMNDKVVSAIDKYLKDRKSDDNILFISNWGTKMNRKSMSCTLKCCARRGGVAEDRINKISNHTLRHTFITDEINAGTPIQDVSLLVGHTNINTTMGYYEENIKNIGLRRKLACSC